MKVFNEEGYIDSDIQDILLELGNVGVGSASIMMGKIIGMRMHIGVPQILPAAEVSGLELPDVDDKKVGILMDFQETLSGCMLYLLDCAFADEILERFHEMQSGGAPIGRSMDRNMILQEFGNLLTGAYLKAIGRYSELRIFVKPADVMEGTERQLAEAALKHVGDCGKVICVATSFSVRYEDGNGRRNVGRVIMLPDERSVGMLSEALYE